MSQHNRFSVKRGCAVWSHIFPFFSFLLFHSVFTFYDVAAQSFFGQKGLCSVEPHFPFFFIFTFSFRFHFLRCRSTIVCRSKGVVQCGATFSLLFFFPFFDFYFFHSVFTFHDVAAQPFVGQKGLCSVEPPM